MASKPQVTKPKSLKAKPKPEVPLGFEWTPMNWLILGAGVLLLVLGYVTLSKGSITLSPILLVLGYCVFLPGALLLRGFGRSDGAGTGVTEVPGESEPAGPAVVGEAPRS